MSILVFAELRDHKFPKATLEVVSYAAGMAEQRQKPAIAVVFGSPEGQQYDSLFRYGADQVIQLKGDHLETFNNAAYAQALKQVAEAREAEAIVFPNGFNGKTLAPRLAARLKAPLATSVTELPETSSEGLIVKRGVYSGKGSEYVQISGKPVLLTVSTNAYGLKEYNKEASLEELPVSLSASDFTTHTLEVNQSSGEVSLPEAEIVVSGGRGLKGPENWHLLENLAQALDASTACSKPVSDMEWRPHSEHVGQTGIAISPNLYVAIGISGAVQHLAGVSSSKVIVAINKDPEAPFFKAADYGIVGDAFEILPKLTEAAKKMKTEA